MTETLFSLNGRIVPESEACVPVTDRGFLYGDGLFETFHAYGRALFRVDHHLERLAGGARVLFIEPRPDLDALKTWIQAAVDAANFPESNVRLTVTRGCGPRGPSIAGPFTPNVVITVTAHQRSDKRKMTEGVAAIISSIRRQETAATSMLKTLNYIDQILARREADAAGVDEALLLNNAGLLCEGSASNIGVFKNGALTIPDPKRVGALPGISQLTALEAAGNLGISVIQTSLSPWDAFQSDEAFLSGSMREITPLIRVGEKTVGNGKPGPLTLRLIAEYRRIVERECKPFKFKE